MKNTEMRIINTNAQASALGWDFQSSLALYFVANDIKNLESVKVEGKTEDIELVYKGGRNIFIQAKCQLDPFSTTTTNQHLQNGLKTLVNASQQTDYSTLFYGTNINNPFVFKQFESLFSGSPTDYSFNELPEKIQKKIINSVNQVAKTDSLSLENFDYAKLRIITLPFYGDDDNTRYRFIKEKLLFWLSRIGLDSIQSNRIFESLLLEFTKNSSKSVSIKKEDLAWIIIIYALDTHNDEFFDEFNLDISEEDAINNMYANFIERKSIDFTLLNEVGQHFKNLVKNGEINSRRTALTEFINKTVDYYEDKIFFDQSNELTKSITKFILWKILKKRQKIERLSLEVGL